MSAMRRMVSMSVASATALGLVLPIAVAPPVSATPCNAPEANAPPPAALPDMPAPAPVVAPPTGRRPRGANEQAPLPKLGPLIQSFGSLLKPLTQAQLQQQARLQDAVTPVPTPPGAVPGVPMPPNVNQAVPQAVPAPPPPPPPAAVGGAPTSLVDFVTGPNSPNHTLERFGISGTDLGIPWDNGDPGGRQVLMAFGDTFGYCAVRGQQWRYNVLFRSQDRDLSHGIHVADGVPNNSYTGMGAGPGQTSPQQHPQGIARDWNHSDLSDVPRQNAIHELHVHQELGPRRRMVDELLGYREIR
jgi:hypothetical protein